MKTIFSSQNKSLILEVLHDEQERTNEGIICLRKSADGEVLFKYPTQNRVQSKALSMLCMEEMFMDFDGNACVRIVDTFVHTFGKKFFSDCIELDPSLQS